MSSEKKKFALYVKESTLDVARQWYEQDNCASMKGIPMKMIQDWLGHSDMSTTVNVRNPHTNKM